MSRNVQDCTRQMWFVRDCSKQLVSPEMRNVVQNRQIHATCTRITKSNVKDLYKKKN